MKKLNLVGQKFGQLTVIKFAYTKNKNSSWLCRCECGNKKIILRCNLVTGKSKSCGCTTRKHGLSETKFGKIFYQMKERCNNKNKECYKDYGSRGITVCDRWSKLENFRDDMYKSYKEHKLNNSYTSIDRINNDGNYCKENCKWATRKEQMNNTRHNRLLTYKEQTLTMEQWAKKLKINNYIIYNRLKYGWSINKIFNTPVQFHNIHI